MSAPNHQAITPKFKEAVQAWIAKDKEYQDLKKKADAVQEERDKIGSFVIPYIAQNNLQGLGLNINGNRLIYKEKTKYSSNTLSLINDCIKNFYHKSDEESKAFITYLSSQKGKSRVAYLSRSESQQK